MSTVDYKSSGVDAQKADEILESFSDYLKTRPQDPRLLSGIGPYASCFALKDLLNQYEDPLLVTCCDGVGTKAKLALDWNRIDHLGEDLIAMNVNDLLCVGGTPLLFLDYYACGKLDRLQLLTLLKSIQRGCEMAHCSLAGGETAEMPGIYQNRDFDLAGFSVGMVDRKNLLGETKVRSGDTLIALASSGLHSNGYTLVRRLIAQEGILPEQFPPFGDRNWAEVLLEPTVIYVSALKNHFASLTGLAHITGAGLYGNLPRILPKGTQALVRSSSWKWTDLYLWLKEKTKLSTAELLSTFNCGIGMIAACRAEKAAELLEKINAAGLSAWKIGEVIKGTEGAEPQVLWQN